MVVKQSFTFCVNLWSTLFEMKQRAKISERAHVRLSGQKSASMMRLRGLKKDSERVVCSYYRLSAPFFADFVNKARESGLACSEFEPRKGFLFHTFFNFFQVLRRLAAAAAAAALTA